MYIYHALINALSARMIHINLNMIFYTQVEHSPTKTTHTKHETERQTTPLSTHPHTHKKHNQARARTERSDWEDPDMSEQKNLATCQIARHWLQPAHSMHYSLHGIASSFLTPKVVTGFVSSLRKGVSPHGLGAKTPIAMTWSVVKLWRQGEAVFEIRTQEFQKERKKNGLLNHEMYGQQNGAMAINTTEPKREEKSSDWKDPDMS